MCYGLIILIVTTEVGCYKSAKISTHEAVNDKLIDSCIRCLKSGDLIFRSGKSFTSTLLTSFNTKNKTYSHAGVIIIENDTPFVYHCIGGEENPNAIMRKDKIRQWCSPTYNSGFGVVRYNVDSSIIHNLIVQVEMYYQQKVKFDMDFDLETDSSMYCTEMIYKSLLNASEYKMNISVSKAMSKTYVSVDDLFLNPFAKFICQIRFK